MGGFHQGCEVLSATRHQPRVDTPAPVRASSSRAGACSTLAPSISRPGLCIQMLACRAARLRGMPDCHCNPVRAAARETHTGVHACSGPCVHSLEGEV